MNIYLSRFAKRYHHDFSFKACSVLDHFFSLTSYTKQKTCVLNAVYIFSHPLSSLSPTYHFSLFSPCHKKVTFEISALCRTCFPWFFNYLDFFLAARNKIFRKASLSLMKEQVSRLAKSAVVQ